MANFINSLCGLCNLTLVLHQPLLDGALGRSDYTSNLKAVIYIK